MDAIVAVYADWGIGAKGTQPLVIPADRRRFRELTMGAAVIVGRRTLEDFPGGKPLPGRENFVLSRRNITIEGAQVVHSPDEAVAAAAQHARCFVIGGDSVFRQMFPHMTRVYVTKIDAAPHSDVFFPNLDADPAWRCVSAEPRAEHDGVGYQFCVYENTEASRSAAFRSRKAADLFCAHPASTASESALMHMWKNTGGQIERVCS